MRINSADVSDTLKVFNTIWTGLFANLKRLAISSQKMMKLGKGRTITFLLGGVTFFVKKLFTSCSWLKKNCLLQGYELKKLSAKQREIFWNTLIFQNFDTNWTTAVDIKVFFNFIEFIKN